MIYCCILSQTKMGCRPIVTRLENFSSLHALRSKTRGSTTCVSRASRHRWVVISQPRITLGYMHRFSFQISRSHSNPMEVYLRLGRSLGGIRRRQRNLYPGTMPTTRQSMIEVRISPNQLLIIAWRRSPQILRFFAFALAHSHSSKPREPSHPWSITYLGSNSAIVSPRPSTYLYCRFLPTFVQT